MQTIVAPNSRNCWPNMLLGNECKSIRILLLHRTTSQVNGLNYLLSNTNSRVAKPISSATGIYTRMYVSLFFFHILLYTHESLSLQLDDSSSGCSATSVHFHGEHITVCNVGNCRAILGHVVEDSDEEEKEEIGAERTFPMLAIPLSHDHTATPPPKDTIQEPLKTPSLTRSLGDSIAENTGVHAEPDMLTSRLCLNDKVLVVATDAIFKYLSNRTIIRFCTDADNAVIASQTIVEAAYDQYLFHEQNVADDMTVIVCFLECDRNAGPDTTEELVQFAKQSAGTATTTDSSGGSAGSLSSSPPNHSDVHAIWDDSEDVPDDILRL